MIRKEAVIAILGSPVAYYTAFAKVLGGVEAGILASQFFYWYGKGHNPQGWIYKTQSEIEDETGLTRRNQETARKKLRQIGVLEEQYTGMPAKLYYRLNLDMLFALMNDWFAAEVLAEEELQAFDAASTGENPQDGGMRHPRMREPAIQGCTDPPSKDVQMRQSRMADSANQGCANAPGMDGAFRHTNTETTTKSTSETTTETTTNTGSANGLGVVETEWVAVDVDVSVAEIPAWILDEFSFFLGNERVANDADQAALAALATYPEHVILQAFDAAQVWLEDRSKGPIHSLGRWLLGTAKRKQEAEQHRGSSATTIQAEIQFETIAPSERTGQQGPAPHPRASPVARQGEGDLWTSVLEELELRVPRGTYDYWVRDTRLVSSEGDEYVIGLADARAKDWIENRFANTLRQTLASRIGRPVQVSFQVLPV